jgi:hypothetical protein
MAYVKLTEVSELPIYPIFDGQAVKLSWNPSKKILIHSG